MQKWEIQAYLSSFRKFNFALDEPMRAESIVLLLRHNAENSNRL